MEGKINKNDVLEIKRETGWTKQICLYDTDHKVGCGNWCAQFGEVERPHDDWEGILMICQNRILKFKKFTKERK